MEENGGKIPEGKRPIHLDEVYRTIGRLQLELDIVRGENLELKEKLKALEAKQFGDKVEAEVKKA